jgi:hypothetical protein
MLLKVGTQVRVSRPGFGCVGTITRVMPQNGMYRVDTAANFHHIKAGEHRIETYTDRRGY